MAPGLLDDTKASATLLDRTVVGKNNFPDNADGEEYARRLDSEDRLREFRKKFIIPSKAALKRKSLGKAGRSMALFWTLEKVASEPLNERDHVWTAWECTADTTLFCTVEHDEDGIYFCGNSLGLQPKAIAKYVQAQLDTWASIAVGGHFTQLEESPLKPWQSLADFAAEQSSRLVGALPSEVAIANTLTVNLHLLMASFYRPTPKRNKVLLEWKAFPSDHVSRRPVVRGAFCFAIGMVTDHSGSFASLFAAGETDTLS